MPIYKGRRPGTFRIVVSLNGRQHEKIVRGSHELAEKVERAILDQAAAKRPKPVRLIRRRGKEDILRIGTKDWARPVVYFVQAGDENGPVKIGHTRDLKARMSALANASAVPLVLLGTIQGGRQLEMALHRGFAHLRLEGEWFQAEDDLFHMIAEMFVPDDALERWESQAG